MTLVATAVIPITVLVTILAMKFFGQSFNLMTLGGIAAAIGLVIDDAIVVVEAIHVKMAAGLSRMQVIESAIGEILAAADWIDVDAGGGVYSAGVFDGDCGGIFSSFGADDGNCAAGCRWCWQSRLRRRWRRGLLSLRRRRIPGNERGYCLGC